MLQRHNYDSFMYLMFKINKNKPNKKTKWIPWKLSWFTQSSLLSKCMDWVSFWRRRRRKKKKRFQGSHLVQRASGVVVVILCVCVGWCVCECVNELCVKVTGCEGGVCAGCVWGVGVGSVWGYEWVDDFWTNGIYNIHCTHEYINCARRLKMNSVSLGGKRNGHNYNSNL